MGRKVQKLILMDITLEYIYKHKASVIRWMEVIIDELKRRAITHDNSKLIEPEISGWRKMDKEPRYPYGSKEYFDKLERYKWLLKTHWKRNRHHPEYWQINIFRKDKDLLDIIETVIDWLSYKENVLSLKQALKIIDAQTKRYGFSSELTELIKNTIINYFTFPGGKETLYCLNSKFEYYKEVEKIENENRHLIDIYC